MYRYTGPKDYIFTVNEKCSRYSCIFLFSFLLGFCLSNQLSCGNGEVDCYNTYDKCNGVWDCREHGGDELHCGKFSINT